MIANYHTHTPFCHHATGEIEEYVLAAIEIGLDTLGFSDHAPYDFKNGYISNFRMSVDETEYYVNSLLELREKYKDKINLLIGYEAEYYPLLFEDMLKNLKKYQLDYLILGLHFTKNEYNGYYSGLYTEDKAILTEYINQVIEGIKTGAFSYIAHPDLLNFGGDDAFYKQEVLRLIDATKKYNTPLELNLLGLYQNRAYPKKAFWETVAGEGAEVILGIDAHTPKEINQSSILLGEEYLKKLNIKPLETLKLKKP